MKKLTSLTFPCAFAMFVFMSISVGLGSASNAEDRAFVSGGGLIANGDQVGIFAANFSAGASGNVTVASHFAGFPKLIASEVACLRIEGNQAWITGVPIQSLPDNLVVVLAIQDNGKDGDLATVWFTRPADNGVNNPSELCGVAPERGLTTFPDLYLTAGNITIHN